MARLWNGTTNTAASSALAQPTSAATISFWGLLTATGGSYVTAVKHQDTATNITFLVFALNLTHMTYYVGTSGAGGFAGVDPGAATLAASTWYHFALSYDTTNGLKTYVNGVSDGTAAANGTILTNASSFLAVGYDPQNAGRFWPGRVADLAEWNVALTQLEITALAGGARPSAIRPKSLLAHIPIDGQQSPEPDLSGNQINLTLTSGPPTLAFGPPFAMFTPRWPQPMPITPPTSILWAQSVM